jgi:hypothetical protein
MSRACGPFVARDPLAELTCMQSAARVGLLTWGLWFERAKGIEPS